MMNQSRFVKLGLLAFGLVVLHFVVLGFSRLVLPFEYAQLVAAPVLVAAVVLVVYLFVWSVLAKLGIREITPNEDA